ncbi:MAG: hypothetical protein AAF735_03130 [Myxococcota bacterium]
MLLPCPSCKKPVFVSGSILKTGPVDVQCSNCGALVKIYEDGSSVLLEGHATATGEAPDLELPEAPAPANTSLFTPADTERSDSHWHEPASMSAPDVATLAPPDASEPTVKEPPRLSLPVAEAPVDADLVDADEPPANWPVSQSDDPEAEAETGRAEVTAVFSLDKLEHAEALEVQKRKSSTSGPVPSVATSPSTPPPPPTGGLPAFMRNAPRIVVTRLVDAIPEVVTSTVDVTDPRWTETDTALARGARSPTPAPEPPPMPAPGPTAPALTTPAFVAPAPGEPDALAFAAAPPASVHASGHAAGRSQGAMQGPSYGAAQSAPVAEPLGYDPDPVDDEEDDEQFEALMRSRNSPLRMVAIAAALILIVAGALVLSRIGDQSPPSPVSAASSVPEPEPLADAGDRPTESLEAEDPSPEGENGSETAERAEAQTDAEPSSQDADAEATETPDAEQDQGEVADVDRLRASADAKSDVPTTRARPKRKRVETPVTPAERPSIPSRDSARAEQLYRQGNLLIQQRKVGLAIDLLKEVTSLDPKHGRAYRSLGVSYMLLGKEGLAISNYKKFVNIHPTHRDADRVQQIISEYERR